MDAYAADHCAEDQMYHSDVCHGYLLLVHNVYEVSVCHLS